MEETEEEEEEGPPRRRTTSSCARNASTCGASTATRSSSSAACAVCRARWEARSRAGRVRRWWVSGEEMSRPPPDVVIVLVAVVVPVASGKSREEAAYRPREGEEELKVVVASVLFWLTASLSSVTGSAVRGDGQDDSVELFGRPVRRKALWEVVFVFSWHRLTGELRPDRAARLGA
ncbi:hypothetical protein VTG60DRAFT_4548 [Thermothelomyces hinnuleus]